MTCKQSFIDIIIQKPTKGAVHANKQETSIVKIEDVIVIKNDSTTVVQAVLSQFCN